MVYLHEELGIEFFAEFIKKSNIKKLTKANSHFNQLVTDAISYVPTRTYFRNRPNTILIPRPDP